MEFPFYNNNLWLFSFSSDVRGDDSTDELITYFMGRGIFNFEINNTTGDVLYVEEVASGEDFSFLRFQGAPYYNATL